uniref:Protein kinase domain-containing protein n=3 Tax=Chrysotila carterae TaxID=13221 RepID=A0A7S4EZY2_CHRCT|mmetsp:Transcript_26069/g.57119  ORF Transcript_26069/g.57119 Transcript_26069/m.57119 type:complete len:373 (+) Transcript_26069:194-1312(+)
MLVVGEYSVDAIELGAGGYGAVYKGKETATGKPVAVKVLSHGRMRVAAIQHEVKLMQNARHKHVIELYVHIQQEDKSFLVMELAEHGELFSRVIDKGNLDEPEAKVYFAQIMGALDFLHGRGIAHRDLKLENVLLDAQDNCKICDFGLAHQYDFDASGKMIKTTLRDICGSKSYAAPEVLAGRGYDGFATDVWSCGICLFAMLAGFFPLDGANASDWRFTRVVQAVADRKSLTHTIFSFYQRPCVLSDEAAALIDAMMSVYPQSRASVADVLHSAWLCGRDKCAPLVAPAQRYLKEIQGNAYEADGAPQYRHAYFLEAGANTLGLQMSMDILEDESFAPVAPVYRTAQLMADMPPLTRQRARTGSALTSLLQ